MEPIANSRMAVDTRPDFGQPQGLFTGDDVGIEITSSDFTARFYDVADDGQRFLAVQNVESEETPEITIVENWIKEFEDR